MEDLLANAFELMTLGMGTVFVFLALLVVVTGVMSKVAAKVAPSEPPPTLKRASKRPAASTTLDPHLKRAIELAVARYRQEH